MSQQQSKSTLDGLPKQFIQSLRVLFDILDHGSTGQVKFVDIENRWDEQGVHGLPKGVIESLRKVTPQSGYLTFERFVAGLKIALLRSRKENQSQSPLKNDKEIQRYGNDSSKRGTGTAPSSSKTGYSHRSFGLTTAAVRPNNVTTPFKTTSLPQLSNDYHVPLETGYNLEAKYSGNNTSDQNFSNKNGIANALESWRKDRLARSNERVGDNYNDRDMRRIHSAPSVGAENRGSGDGKSSVEQNGKLYNQPISESL